MNHTTIHESTPRTRTGTNALRAIVLRYPATTCVVLAQDILAIDQDGADARVAVGDTVVELSRFLPTGGETGDIPVRLIVQTMGRRLAFRTAAAIEMLEVSSLYRLPRLLRDAGCRPWVRGFAVLEGGASLAFDLDAQGEPQSEPPALWIDLAQLARTQVFGLEADASSRM